MPFSHNEDSQPNEIRFSRKGNERVPTIRTTRTTRGFFRGRFRGRGQIPYPQASSIRIENDISFTKKRPLEKHDYSQSSFLLRNDRDPPTRLQARAKQSIRLEQDIDLPSSCWKNIFGSAKSRKEWIRREIPRFERERRVKVYSHVWLDRSARLYYFDSEASHPESFRRATPEHSGACAPEDQIKSSLSKENKINGEASMKVFLATGYEIPKPSSSKVPGEFYEIVDLTGEGDGIDNSARVGPPTGPSVVQETETVVPEPLGHRCQNKFRSGVLMVPLSSRAHASSSSANLPASPKRRNPEVIYLDDSSESDSPLPPRPKSLKRRQPDQDNAASVNHTPTLLQDIRESAIYASFTARSGAQSFHGQAYIDGDIVQLQIQAHDKPRRILVSSTDGSAIAVTRQGFIDCLDISPIRHKYEIRSPHNPSYELVDDACMLEGLDQTVLLLGHARDAAPVSLVRVSNEGSFKIKSWSRPSNGMNKSGVSAVTALLQPLMFASGGHDHIVHLWSIQSDLSSASPQRLAIKHTSLVQSLLSIRDTSNKLISAGADCNVHIWDISSERVVNTLKLSNSVFHVHATSSPFCTLLEVANRELQFEIRDHRLVPEKAVQRFGYETERPHGRYIKGSLSSSLFACGGRNGHVRIWDLRSTMEKPIMVHCFEGQKVVHVNFTRSQIIACSEDRQFAQVKYEG